MLTLRFRCLRTDCKALKNIFVEYAKLPSRHFSENFSHLFMVTTPNAETGLKKLHSKHTHAAYNCSRDTGP